VPRDGPKDERSGISPAVARAPRGRSWLFKVHSLSDPLARLAGSEARRFAWDSRSAAIRGKQRARDERIGIAAN